MRIKNMISICWVLSLAITSCKNNNISEQEIEKIRSERDSLLEVTGRKDSSINAFLVSFNDIERNLASIKAKQETVTLRWSGDAELKRNVQEEIMEDIKVINEMIEENQKKISTLNNIIIGNDNKIEELNGTVNLLIQHINDKNHELSILNKSLTEKNKELSQRNKVVFRVPK